MSSNFCSKPVDVSKYGLIFAGAQKNVGPAGVTIVIVREDLLDKKLDLTPTMCDYKIMAASESMHNTPPCFSIYICGLYFEYLKKVGGLQYWVDHNQKKANLLYDFIDGSNGFYNAPIEKAFRSKMNVPFRIKNSLFDYYYFF
jgi:phosphoserine aminotransferase